MTDRYTLVERIRKLLRRTVDNGASRAETEAAVALAHRLMVKHGIDRPEVDAPPRRRPGEPLAAVVWNAKRRDAAGSFVSHIVQSFFHARVLVFRRPGASVVTVFAARQYELDVAAYVWMFLLRRYRKLWADWRRRDDKCGGLGRRHRQLSFYAGLTQGLEGLLQKQHEHALRHDPAARTALARSDALLVQFLRRNIPQLREPDERPIQGDLAAILAGRATAGRVHIRKAVR